MFGINFNVTAKDVGVYAGVPLALGGAALLTRLVYDRVCDRRVFPEVKPFLAGLVVVGGIGATSGVVTAYLTKRPLEKEVLTAVGYSLGSMWILASIFPTEED